MPKYVPFLRELIWRGFRSGLRWETKGEAVRKASGFLHTHRFLLHFPGSFQLRRTIVVDLGSTNKTFINRVMADFYHFAADNVRLCGELSPEDFFAVVKDTQEWAVNIENALFWRFTYRLFHARALFIDTYVATPEAPPSTELTRALDRFRNTFFAYYDPDTLPEGSYSKRKKYQRFCNNKRAEYFGLSSADYEGDGTDRLFETYVLDMSVDPVAGQYRPAAVRPEEDEVGIGFFYDEGHDKPTYGRTELPQNPTEQKDSQGEKDR